MYPSRPRTPLHRFFAGLTEQTFESRLGVADPALVDYISELLVRFVHCDTIFAVRNLAGRRLDQITEMLLEAEARLGTSRRDVHRHIGDFTLFWTGVYPEALRRMQNAQKPDHLLVLQREGKRSYYIASTIPGENADQENQVLERLSHDFELCQYGLSEVRREWERRNPEGGDPRPLVIN